MLSDEKYISQEVGVVHEELKIIFLLIGGLIMPANVVWIANHSKRMMVSGVAMALQFH